MGKTRLDLTDQKFNSLTVIRLDHVQNQTGHKKGGYWLCRCDCGNEGVWNGSQVKEGEIKSCGCQTQSLKRKAQLRGHELINGQFWSEVRCKAKEREIEFTLTIEEAWAQWLTQGGKCIYTGEQLQFTSCAICKDRTASLDRIDSNKGYTANNIQWTHKIINMMKQRLSHTDFLNWVSKISLHQMQISS